MFIHVPPFRHGVVTDRQEVTVCAQVEPSNRNPVYHSFFTFSIFKPEKPARQLHVYVKLLLLMQLNVLFARHGWERHGLSAIVHVGPV